MDITWSMLATVCPLIFFASFADSIGGGGGLISLPAYLLAGLPPAMASGSNKLSASAGTLIAAIKYYRGGKVLILPALAAAAGAFPGAYLGAEALKAVSEEFARAFMLGAIPIAAIAVVLVKPSQSGAARFQGAKMLWLCFGIGCICGAYDGFFGPGTGTIYIALFTGLTGMEMVTASGSAKIANLSSNLAALVSMMLSGDVCFPLAIPAMVFSIAGGYLGAKFAIKRGAKAVRVVMLLVLAGILAKLVFQL